jgi:hypothetical protein
MPCMVIVTNRFLVPMPNPGMRYAMFFSCPPDHLMPKRALVHPNVCHRAKAMHHQHTVLSQTSE